MAHNSGDDEDQKELTTVIPAGLYDEFQSVAVNQEIPIEDLTRIAIAEYVTRHTSVDSDDPIFTPLEWDEPGKLDDTASEEIVDIVYDQIEQQLT